MAVNEKGGVRIPIVTYYSDKGVKAASASLQGLETAASKLAKTFGVTLGAAALVSFGKKSLDVFAKEQKAMAQLTNTLYNLGLAYDAIGVNKFLTDVQDATGVAKDELAPALQTLTTYTLNYAKSQELLNTALNVAAANQLDVGTVADALAKAYAGNTKALVGLGIGITATEAKTESFAQIMAQLNSTFKDAALVDNYKTRLDKLKVAAADAMSYIGQGIAQALNTLTADGNITKTMENLRNLGKIISEEIVGFAAGIKQLFKDISEIPIVKVILGVVGGAIKGLDKLLGISKAAKQDIANFDKKMAADQAKADAKAIAAAKQQAALNKKLQAQQLADQKKLNAEAAKKAALDKAALELKKAASIFDLEQIEIAAALQNKDLSENDKARLTLKKDLKALEDAINEGNVKLATTLAEQVKKDYERLGFLQEQEVVTNKIKALTDALKPKDLINLDNLNTAISKINQINALLTPTQAAAFQAAVPNQGMTSAYETLLPPIIPDQAINDLLASQGLPTIDLGNTNAPVVNVTVSGNADKLVDIIMDTTQQQSANGVSTRVIRNTGGLNW